MLAFSCTDSGRGEIYVTQFPSGSGRWRVSQEGGIFPVWLGDSREIYFIGSNAPVRIFAASVKPGSGDVQVENVRPLFPVQNVVGTGELFDGQPRTAAAFCCPCLRSQVLPL